MLAVERQRGIDIGRERIRSWSSEETRAAPGNTAKLNDAKVVQIRARVAAGEPMLSVARAFGVGRVAVVRVVRRQTWGHVPEQE
jgi:hypothetical protein